MMPGGALLRRGSLRAAIYDRLTRSLGKEPETATPRDIYDALSLAVREELSARWLATAASKSTGHTLEANHTRPDAALD